MPKTPADLPPDRPLPVDTPPSASAEILDSALATDAEDLPAAPVDPETLDDEPPGLRGGRTRSPIRGRMTFLELQLDVPLLVGLEAWLAARTPEWKEAFAREQGVRLDTLEKGEQLRYFLLDVVGRDMEADEDRPPDAQEYAIGAVLTRTFRSYRDEGVQVQVEAARRAERERWTHLLADRLRERYPSLSAEELALLLGEEG